MYTFETFHDSTAADFRPCERPDREPDFVSPSGSRYWDLGHGVVRESDHWGMWIRSCHWFLAGAFYTGPARCGFAAWSDFTRPAEHPLTAPALAAMQADFDRRAAHRRAVESLGVGQRVRVTRSVTVGRSSRRVTETLEFTITRATACFLWTDRGWKLARGTFTAVEVLAA